MTSRVGRTSRGGSPVSSKGVSVGQGVDALQIAHVKVEQHIYIHTYIYI